MQTRLIFSALRQHKVAALLIALEVALACAVLCNAASMIVERLSVMAIDSGVDENALGVIVVTGFSSDEVADLNARMVAGLRAVPGVESVHVVSTVPFGAQWGVAGITLDRKTHPAVVGFYEGEAGSIEALGLDLVEGHWPAPGDYQAQPQQGYFPASARVLVTRALAHKLWPDATAVGKEFWQGDSHFRVIGVMQNLAMAQPRHWGKRAPGWSVFIPMQPGGMLAGTYLIRAQPEDLDHVMVAARARVAKIAPGVVIDRAASQTVSDLRARFFQSDRTMAGMLLGVIVALLGVTALGIVGLASFWVAQRRKQIGVRRALGATRGDILRYFQIENLLIVSAGVLIGFLLAYAVNLILMRQYGTVALPLWYLAAGAAAMLLLGQLAVLVPALRASRVPPVVATRSV